MQIFDVIIFFELRTIQHKTVKPTYLCLYLLYVLDLYATDSAFFLLSFLNHMHCVHSDVQLRPPNKQTNNKTTPNPSFLTDKARISRLDFVNNIVLN